MYDNMDDLNGNSPYNTPYSGNSRRHSPGRKRRGSTRKSPSPNYKQSVLLLEEMDAKKQPRKPQGGSWFNCCANNADD